ncbi:hypothetical protein L1887_37747 [Cichorium endivia]|nr:hypothetical protein L1887_37747 [Cichorium endivia]
MANSFVYKDWLLRWCSCKLNPVNILLANRMVNNHLLIVGRVDDEYDYIDDIDAQYGGSEGESDEDVLVDNQVVEEKINVDISQFCSVVE